MPKVKEPKKIGRPTDFNEIVAENVLKLVADRGFITDADVIVPHRTIYRWMDSNEEFRHSMELAKKTGIEKRRKAAYTRGLENNLELPEVADRAYRLAQKDEELMIRRMEAEKEQKPLLQQNITNNTLVLTGEQAALAKLAFLSLQEKMGLKKPIMEAEVIKNGRH
jgi:hypothetical protein